MAPSVVRDAACRRLPDPGAAHARRDFSKRGTACIRAGRSPRASTLGFARAWPREPAADSVGRAGRAGRRRARIPGDAQLEVRVGWQHNWRDGGRVRERGYPGAASCCTGSDVIRRSPMLLVARCPAVRAFWPRSAAARPRRDAARSTAACQLSPMPRRPASDRARPRRRIVGTSRSIAAAASSTRVGARPGVRRAAARPRAHGSARRAVRAARARDHGRHVRRVPEQRHDVPQRVLAVADQAVRSRPLPAGPDGPVACSIGPASFPCSATSTRT